MKERGVSLVESLLVVVATAAIVFLMANIPNALGLITKARHLSLAREIALKQLEDKRATSFANLVPDAVSVSDPRLAYLPQGAGTVTVADCDPLICTNAEPIKKITVEITWKASNKDQKVALDTFIGEGGLNQ